MTQAVTLSDIFKARAVIAGLAVRTPLVRSHTLSERFAADVYLKLETLQPTGAFKLRGAVNRIAAMDKDQLAHGVVTASTGNHGRAVAWAANKLGTRAIICLSSLVPENKIAAIKSLGAEVRISGDSQDDAFIEARQLSDEQGMTLVDPFDDPLIIAGQGTIGLEIMEDIPDLDRVLIGLSGGGLLSGIGVAVKAINPSCRVVGVSMENGAAMMESLATGHPVEVTETATLADSLGGGIGMDNRYTFNLVRQVIDEQFKVSEDAIGRAMLDLLDSDKMWVEGAAAVGLAALDEHLLDISGQKVALIVSGNSVATSMIDTLRRRFS